MMARPVMMILVCSGLFIIVQMLVPKVLAMKKFSNVDEFLIDDQRNNNRKKYLVQRDRNNKILGNPDIGIAYDIESFEPDANPEKLSAFIVDYANMIRNDVILLDNSVETRTRKRGNIKVKKQSNHVIPDIPCSCEYKEEKQFLGNNIYPRYVETRNCSTTQLKCIAPYVCKETLYNITIFKKRMQFSKRDSDQFDGFIPEKYPVSVGCVCTRDYDIQT